MSEIKKEDLIFTDVGEGSSTDAVLGTLEGPCADFIDGTRNGRHYSEELWDNVFRDPIVSEMIEAGGIVGELDHPIERTETDSSRIAIIMREKPTKKNGKLWAKFDILNTPLGKIAYTLAKAGFKLGISSRGSGDVSPNYDGTEEVDASTYDFKAFDLVLIPAVKAARLNLVTEGLETNGFNYKKVLLESIESASDEDKKIMRDTLKNLNINLYDNPSQTIDCDYIAEDQTNGAVDNTKVLFEELQNALKENRELAVTVTSLQEKLSVSYAKEVELKEEVEKQRKSIKKLSSDAKALGSLRIKVSNLTEELSKSNAQLNNQKEKNSQIYSQYVGEKNVNRSLNEQMSTKVSEVNNLDKKISLLENRYARQVSKLNEDITELEKAKENQQKEYSQKLSSANKLVEKYKKIASRAVDKYIDSKALMLGVSSQEIKNRLSESYTFDEIDNVCETLRDYKINMSRLPFSSMKLNENIQMKATPSQNESILPANNSGDEVDDQLRSLAGL